MTDASASREDALRMEIQILHAEKHHEEDRRKADERMRCALYTVTIAAIVTLFLVIFYQLISYQRPTTAIQTSRHNAKYFKIPNALIILKL